MTGISANAGRPVPGIRRRVVLTGATAAIGSAVAAVVVATIAKAVGVEHATQLQPAPLAFLSVIGVLVATMAWVGISRAAADPVALLRRVVPVVLVVSFVPDLIVGLGKASAGTAVTLALAHVSVFAVTIPLLIKRLHPTWISRGV